MFICRGQLLTGYTTKVSFKGRRVEGKNFFPRFSFHILSLVKVVIVLQRSIKNEEYKKEIQHVSLV